MLLILAALSSAVAHCLYDVNTLGCTSQCWVVRITHPVEVVTVVHVSGAPQLRGSDTACTAAGLVCSYKAEWT
jgi:hypothetical protein